MGLLFDILGITDRKTKQHLSTLLKVSSKELDYYNDNNILPRESMLDSIEKELHINKHYVMLKMGILNEDLRKLISDNAESLIKCFSPTAHTHPMPELKFETALGRLYQGDCLDLLANTPDNTFDLVFADPPFNLDKLYPSNIDDNLKLTEYINWTERWLTECVRTLKNGGSLFLWNLPKWNTYFSAFLNQRLNFKHWIAVDIKYSLPINGRLYPSHYGLLYYVKGEKANTFNPDRLPMDVCLKCFVEIKDYGGYKNKMNPLGINMTDVWYDIPPVRHTKYKGRQNANELSTKLLDRIIQMSTQAGDVVFDPFGGSGTTYIVAELKQRKWVGIELGPTEEIIERFQRLPLERALLDKYRINYNHLFPTHIDSKRKAKNLWTCDSFTDKEK